MFYKQGREPSGNFGPMRLISILDKLVEIIVKNTIIKQLDEHGMIGAMATFPKLSHGSLLYNNSLNYELNSGY